MTERRVSGRAALRGGSASRRSASAPLTLIDKWVRARKVSIDLQSRICDCVSDRLFYQGQDSVRALKRHHMAGSVDAREAAFGGLRSGE